MAIKRKPRKKPRITKDIVIEGADPEAATTISKKNFLEALALSLGVVSTACTKANIARSMYYHWMENDPDFVRAVKDVQELLLDFGESKLFQLIQKGNPKCTMFLLETKGKKRGYVKKREVEAYGKNGRSLYPSNPYNDMTDAEIEDELRSLEEDES